MPWNGGCYNNIAIIILRAWTEFLQLIFVIVCRYYVTYSGNFRQQRRSMFIIGDGTTTTDGTTTFTNPPPETGVNYYVFIRLYSDIDVSQTWLHCRFLYAFNDDDLQPTVFSDSELSGILSMFM